MDLLKTGSAEILEPPPGRGSIAEVFVVALGLGLSSFGGPIAHIGYFERTYVQKLRWLTPAEFTGLVALCQLVPGPASSQLGYLVGLKRAGWAGAFAAWAGFILPSALLMFSLAIVAPGFSGPYAQAVFHGLQLVAVAVVAQAVWSMGKVMCPDPARLALGIIACTTLLIFNRAEVQLLVIAGGAVGGMVLCQILAVRAALPTLPVAPRVAFACAALFAALLALALVAAKDPAHSLFGLAAIFYRAGSLVFGGGHVVMPLLHDALVPTHRLTDSAFLQGYGAVQAVPGPLFTFAAYLGSIVAPSSGGIGIRAIWSVTALFAIFLPGGLIAVASLAVWNWVGHHPRAQSALAGINAAVVGVLAAALYNPVWTSAVHRGADVAIATLALVFLLRWRVPPILIVVLCTVGSAFELPFS